MPKDTALAPYAGKHCTPAPVGGAGRIIDPIALPPDPELMAQWTAAGCLRDGLLPWRRVGGRTIILTSDMEDFDRHRDQLTAVFGRVRRAEASAHRMQLFIQRAADQDLVVGAETRTAADDSCRDFNARRFLQGLLAVGAVLTCALIAAPSATITALSLVALANMAGVSALKLAAALTVARGQRPTAAPPLPDGAELPVITMLVPLFKEREIATDLLRRLGRISYPRDRLDLCLVVERDDHCTQSALSAAELPDWVRAITVPRGTCRTKPRAMNYALDFTRGDIVGIWDAEDAPDPDQLLEVARAFAAAPDDVVCLQGVLDFYNARSNWLARCFTMEYATWFRVVLPGLERLGFVLPLGGTTLFFRRHALEELGGWDAQNVTEDADLGLRLARRGYRTQMINTVTREEANARLWPWIRQRSRWLKGYAMTYLVHMRRPRQLWRDLGPKRFIGVQMQFAGTLVNFVLLPVVWSFWLAIFGLGHPFLDSLGALGLLGLAGLFLMMEVMHISIAAWAVAMAGYGRLMLWAPSLHVYFPLAALASYKGLWELATRPFFWDKTRHGIFAPTVTSPQPRRASAG